MSAHIVADRTADGWNITVLEGDSVTVQTNGAEIRITVDPDDGAAKPLEVTLDQPDK